MAAAFALELGRLVQQQPDEIGPQLLPALRGPGFVEVVRQQVADVEVERGLDVSRASRRLEGVHVHPHAGFSQAHQQSTQGRSGNRTDAAQDCRNERFQADHQAHQGINAALIHRVHDSAGRRKCSCGRKVNFLVGEGGINLSSHRLP